MHLLYVIYTHNRARTLRECLRSLFANNSLRPQRVVIIDDGSAPSLKAAIGREIEASDSVVDFVSFKQNVGYGRAAEIGFALADMFDPKYCFFIESDYVFRKNGLDDVMEVLEDDRGRHAAGIAGYSHPDFANSQATAGRYLQEMQAMFGVDHLNRAILYKPFPFAGRSAEFQIQYVSNSCGAMYLNWELVKDIRKLFYPEMERRWLWATCNKGRTPALLDDGAMSQGLSHFWTLYARARGWDTDRYAALIDIIPSVANHLCGGGMTARGSGYDEGTTFVGSVSFPRDYDSERDPVSEQRTHTDDVIVAERQTVSHGGDLPC